MFVLLLASPSRVYTQSFKLTYSIHPTMHQFHTMCVHFCHKMRYLSNALWDLWDRSIGLLPHTYNCGLRMRRECRERFPRHRLRRKPLGADPSTHHGSCVTHVPWCMSGSLTRDGGENLPGIPGASTRNFTYLVRGPYRRILWESIGMYINIYKHNDDQGPFRCKTSQSLESTELSVEWSYRSEI